MNWRKNPPKRAGMYWARLGPEDPDPKTFQVIERDGALHVLQLGIVEVLPLDAFVRSKGGTLQVYGPMRIPKTPIPRAVYEDAPRDSVIDRFSRQTDPAVVLAMVNEYLAKLPPEDRQKIPRTLKLPESISSGEELSALAEAFNRAAMEWMIDNEHGNDALDHVAHFLEIALTRIEMLTGYYPDGSDAYVEDR